MKIVSVQEMRAIEQASVQLGVSLDQLQRNAARSVADEIERLFGAPGNPLLFLVGPGNNGRDTLIAADLLRQRGRSIRVFLMPKVGSEDVLDQLRSGGAEIDNLAEAADLSSLRRWMREASVVVDGLLGIGIQGAVREPMAGVIAAVNEESARYRVPVVAVDLPSGIDADSGEIAGTAVRAEYTVSLGCVKAGLVQFPAAEYVGTLVPVGIGLPAGSYETIRLELLEAEAVAALIPPRPKSGHKGTFGRTLVVAGSRNFVGASFLCGAAAGRSGAGLVTLAVPEGHRNALATLFPEATFLPLLESESETSAHANAQAIVELLPDCDALAVGPGLGQGAAQTRLVMEVLEANQRLGVNSVVDADGLNSLARVERWWERIGPGHVVTPHPGEMSRLTGKTTDAINADRWKVAVEAARLWGQTVVLKGAFTVVADPSGDSWMSPFANSALASGGTGDVLTGLIAGFMAQDATPTAAAAVGVYVHALAAEGVLERHGIDRLLASDLLPEIPRAISSLLQLAARA